MIIYGRNVIITALEAKQKIQEIWITKNASGPGIKRIRHLCKTEEIPIQEKPGQVMDKKAGFGIVHQGVIAYSKGFDYYTLNTVMKDLDMSDGYQFIVILDQINDPHNLGAIIRTAESAGAKALIIPAQNSAQVTPTVMKVSAGAVFYLPIVKVTSIEDSIRDLKEKGFHVVSTDGEADQNLFDVDYKKHIALVIGNEGTGIRNKIKNLSDNRVRIPIHGKTESLNASVAAGICMYHIKENQISK